ncbi:MAG: CPBP family intramembrane metalloprotease [Terracidiphilus sp.]|nr:CPBP family intramembrane metalloprotease [Terracidiphilus sp.]
MSENEGIEQASGQPEEGLSVLKDESQGGPVIRPDTTPAVDREEPAEAGNNGIQPVALSAEEEAEENLLVDTTSPASSSEPESCFSTVPEELPVDPAQTVPVELEPSPLFQYWSQPEIFMPTRSPNLGDLGILGVLAFFGLLAASLLTRSALYFHLFGISTVQKAVTDIHYTLGSEAVLYLFTVGSCLLIFPLVWHKGFFAGLHWNGAIALRMRQRLFGAASICFVIALLNGILLPGPVDTPIDKIFRSPGAAWMLFAFGVTFAPFFEEIVFRGFLLPALCTACDWMHERATGEPARPLDENGHPQWSMPAMAVASLAVSIPFALMHAEQTGHALGPFLLLVCVSLVLCWARLSTRSLAASVLVHASYNFLLFSLMLLGTSGFKHLDKM